MLELNSVNSPSASPRSSPCQQTNGHEAQCNTQHFLPMLNLNEANKSAFNLFGQSSSPLSALHNMSDLSCKLNLSSSALTDTSSYHHQSPLNVKSSMGLTTSSSSSSPTPCSTSATSHYINDILSRPTSFNTAVPGNTFGGALSGTLPRFPLASVPGSVCFSAAAAAANGLGHKMGSLNDLQGRHLYWPSMVQNSNLWRERLATAGTCCVIPTMFILFLIYVFSKSILFRKGRQKETHSADLFRSPNIRAGENLWADQVPSRSWKS